MNLPNKLTLLRIILIPFMMFFYLADFIPYGIGKIVAIAIFILASLTDLLDGKIARKYNLVTDLGKFLDPIADKLLTATALLLILADGTIPAPWGVIIVAIIIGYISGIIGKIVNNNISYVLIFYCINLCVVTLDLVVYFINKHKENEGRNQYERFYQQKTAQL